MSHLKLARQLGEALLCVALATLEGVTAANTAESGGAEHPEDRGREESPDRPLGVDAGDARDLLSGGRTGQWREEETDEEEDRGGEDLGEGNGEGHAGRRARCIRRGRGQGLSKSLKEVPLRREKKGIL